MGFRFGPWATLSLISQAYELAQLTRAVLTAVPDGPSRGSSSRGTCGGDDGATMAHPTLPGVVNLGNTCFLGSTLQALAATHPFPDVLVRPDSTAVSHHPVLGYLPGPSCSPDPPPSGLPITSALSHVLAKLAKDESTAAKPAQLLKELSKKREEYADYDQQDAHELLRVLVDGVRMEEVDLMKGWEQKEKERKEASPRGRRKRMSSATGTLRPHITVSRPSFTSSRSPSSRTLYCDPLMAWSRHL